MDLTRDNFEELYPQLEKAINECDFCAIDGEFTGVLPYRELNAFDTPKTRYDKMKKLSNNYLLLQFGLCIFKKQEDSSYEALAYNCYLYPKSSEKSKFCKSVVFSCLSSSVEFLSDQNFDFNKVFRHGITYISKEHEEHWRERIMQEIEAKNKDNSKNKPIQYPHNKQELKETITKIMTEIDEFMENEESSEKEIKMSDYLVRKFTEKNIRNKYFGKLRYESKVDDNKEHVMMIIKIKSDEINADITALEKEIGFSKLIWALSKSNKLIIGHNILIDLMETLKHFFSPLPDQYEDFRVMAHTVFPNVLDTKHMALSSQFKDLISQTDLANLDSTLSQSPFKHINIVNCKYAVDSDKLHEAGFDAFLTGYCYIRMLNYLESLNPNKQDQLLTQFLNKIHLMKSYDTPYMDLVVNQEQPNRDNVFYVEFPSFWDDQDLFNLFEPYGKIFISRLNRTSALIALKTVDKLKKVNAQLVGVSGREYRVYFYKTYINQLSKKLNNGNEGEVKKRKAEQIEVDEDDNKNNTVLNGNKYAALAQMETDEVDDDDNSKNTKNNNNNKKSKVNGEKNKPSKSGKLFDECNDWN